MSRRLRFAVLALCCAAILAVAGQLWAADEQMKKEEKGKPAGDMSEMGMDMPKATPMHSNLQKALGKWKYKNTMTMDPSQPAMTTEGTEEVVSLCGGLFIQVSNVAGGPMPFEGHGIEGYDVHKKKYVGSWVDNWGSGIYSYEGTCNPEGTIFTYMMTGPNPMTGEPMTHTMVTEYKGANARTMKMWQGPKAEGAPTMVIEYTKTDVADRR